MSKDSILAIVAVCVLLLAGGIYFTLARANTPHPWIITKAFFTDDDGQTWFVDDISKIPPFDHNGKTAVRCVVCTQNGKQFAAYLMRYSDKAKAALAAARGTPKEADVLDQVDHSGLEFKKPHAPDSQWARVNTPAGDVAMDPIGPDGTKGGVRAVFP